MKCVVIADLKIINEDPEILKKEVPDPKYTFILSVTFVLKEQLLKRGEMLWKIKFSHYDG